MTTKSRKLKEKEKEKQKGFSEAYSKIHDLYATETRESTLLADQLLIGFIPEVKRLIPTRSVCRKFHGTKKRRNEIFKMLELLDKKGLGLNVLTFSLASIFFSEHYMYIRNDALILPWGAGEYFIENGIDEWDVWDRVNEL